MARSTVLDAFTADQLRIMKVGGNLNANEYLKQHGGNNANKDAKSKYTSRAAVMYKEKLIKWVEDDKAQ
jgi:ADP-ribosylation factor GTPase-activating protein 2/3